LVMEGEPFVIEVPVNMKARVLGNRDVVRRLCNRSGCKEVIFRPVPQFAGNNTRMYVSAKGTQEALNRLRSLLSVRHDVNLQAKSNQALNRLMVEAVYTRLFNDNYEQIE